MLLLAAPIVLSQLAQVSNGLVDTLMAGPLGPESLAGVALGASVFFWPVIICLGIVLAVGPMVSQAHGAGDDEAVTRATRQGLWMALVLTLPAVGALYVAGPLLVYSGQDAEVQRIATGYLRAIVWGVFPFLGFGALRSFIEGLSKPVLVTVIALSGVGVNALANWTYIHGHFGFPRMGAVGVGWATATSFWYLFLTLVLLMQTQRTFRRYGVLAHLRRPDRTYFRELFRIGWPMGLSFGIEIGLFTTTAILVGSLGATSLAAHQIALQCAAFTFMVPLAIGIAGSVRVGQAVGRGQMASAARAGWTAIGLSFLFMCGTAVVFLTIPEIIIGRFLDPSETRNVPVVALGVTLLGIAGVFQVFDGIQAAAIGALRGLKDTRTPMLIGLVTYWGLGLTTAYVLGLRLGYGAPGLWWGLVIGLAGAAVGMTSRFAWQMHQQQSVR